MCFLLPVAVLDEKVLQPVLLTKKTTPSVDVGKKPAPQPVIVNMPICEICKRLHDGSYATGRHCSSTCARTVGGLAHKKRCEQKRQYGNHGPPLSPVSPPVPVRKGYSQPPTAPKHGFSNRQHSTFGFGFGSSSSGAGPPSQAQPGSSSKRFNKRLPSSPNTAAPSSSPLSPTASKPGNSFGGARRRTTLNPRKDKSKKMAVSSLLNAEDKPKPRQ